MTNEQAALISFDQGSETFSPFEVFDDFLTTRFFFEWVGQKFGLDRSLEKPRSFAETPWDGRQHFFEIKMKKMEIATSPGLSFGSGLGLSLIGE